MGKHPQRSGISDFLVATQALAWLHGEKRRLLALMERKSFPCPVKGECNDGDCSRDFCRLKNAADEEAKRQNEKLAEAEQELLREHARNFATEVLKAKRIKPTEDKIAKLVRHPKVVAEARRRLRWPKS